MFKTYSGPKAAFSFLHLVVQMPPKQTPKGGSQETRRRLNKKRCLKPLITKFLNLEDQPKFPFGPQKINTFLNYLKSFA